MFQVEAEGLRTDFPPLADPALAGAIGTLLATDLVGWGKIMREYGDDAAIAAAITCYRIVDEQVRAHDGRVLEHAGDATLSLFSRAEDAIVAAAVIRAALAERGWVDPSGNKPKLSAAIHTGRLARPSEGHLGSPAVRVFRLGATAEPGQILVSHATHAMLEGQILDRLSLRDLGERMLPGTEQPTHVYELVDDGAFDE